MTPSSGTDDNPCGHGSQACGVTFRSPDAARIAVESGALESAIVRAMPENHPDVLTFAEKARKFLVAAGGNAIAVATVAVDVLADSDLSTTGGVAAAVVAAITAWQVYARPNATA